MRYKNILLDWDGNLAKTLDLWLNAYRKVLLDRGIKKTDHEIAAGFGQMPRHMKSWGVKDINQAIDDADKIAKKLLPRVELYPSVFLVLDTLVRGGHTLALITSSTQENVQHLLESHNLTELFSTTISGDDIANHKPHSEPLDKAMIRIKASRKDTVMIGDSDKDVGAAHNANIDCILFYPPEHKKFHNFENLTSLKPTYIVHDFKEILTIVS